MVHSRGYVWAVPCLAALLALPAWATEGEAVRNGDLEMHCVALASSELTPEAAQEFNVVREPGRAVLMITVFRHLGPGKTETQPSQVFAGAINARNSLSNIPVREMRKGDAVYYLGEFRITPPDTLRFLVNASASHGKPLKAEFTHSFAAP